MGRGQNIMGRGFNIPYIEGLKYHGYGAVDIPWVWVSKYHG